MDTTKIIAIAVIGSFLVLFLKEYKPAFSLLLSLAITCAVLFFILPEIEKIINLSKAMLKMANGENVYISSILKICALACLSWLGSDICKDAGLNTVSSAVVIAGKTACIAVCIPIIEQLFKMILSILP